MHRPKYMGYYNGLFTKNKERLQVEYVHVLHRTYLRGIYYMFIVVLLT